MASKALASTALLFSLNLLFFSLVSSHSVPCSPPTHKPPQPHPKPSPQPSCPRDTLKLGVCANVLSGLLSAVLGQPPKQPCCSLLEGLADVEAALCLCTAIKADILGINLNIPISLGLLLNHCGKNVPSGFQCA